MFGLVKVKDDMPLGIDGLFGANTDDQTNGSDGTMFTMIGDPDGGVIVIVTGPVSCV